MIGRNNKIIRLLILLICCNIFVVPLIYGQDRLPVVSKEGRPSSLSEETPEYRRPEDPVMVGNSMPKTFKNTRENIIMDTAHVLIPFFEKLRVRREPVRIVHIGDSHIRGHVLPLTVRRNLENEFGGEFQQLMEFLLKEIGTETNGESLGVHYVDEETGETTVNLGIVYYDGEETYFTLDVRYPKNEDPKVVDDTLINHINSYTFDVLRKNNHKILYVPKDSELVTKLVHVYEEETGEHLEPLAIGGGTYAKKFPNMVAFGPVFPGEADVIHQPDEHVEVEKLLRALQITAAAMYELAKK